ncbi:MAG: 50S ribosomal protein L11 methyltransferase [Bdellovibrionota bacterium]
MKDSFFVRINVKGLERIQREALSTLVIRLASRFSFRGLEDWTVDLASSTKILGAEREFHDLQGLGKTSEQLVVYFGSRKDAASFGDILRNAFADLSVSKPIRQVKRDWMKTWRKYYKPVRLREAGTTLVITPAWRAAPKGVASVRIYPGQAFGTGTHPTTRLCLRLYLQHRQETKSILDFGAGTGILVLGAMAVDKKVRGLAVESDPEALDQARKNARINRAKLKFSLKMSKGAYDLVFANVLAPVLVTEKKKLAAAVKKGGVIILSGILKSEGAKFLRDFKVPGLKLVEELSEGDWVAFAMRKA